MDSAALSSRLHRCSGGINILGHATRQACAMNPLLAHPRHVIEPYGDDGERDEGEERLRFLRHLAPKAQRPCATGTLASS